MQHLQGCSKGIDSFEFAIDVVQSLHMAGRRCEEEAGYLPVAPELANHSCFRLCHPVNGSLPYHSAAYNESCSGSLRAGRAAVLLHSLHLLPSFLGL